MSNLSSARFEVPGKPSTILAAGSAVNPQEALSTATGYPSSTGCIYGFYDEETGSFYAFSSYEEYKEAEVPPFL